MRHVEFECRDIGNGVETGSVTGLWDEPIWTGARPFLVASVEFYSADSLSYGDVLYLFPDEVLSDEQVPAPRNPIERLGLV